jgi:hypothetical protein
MPTRRQPRARHERRHRIAPVAVLLWRAMEAVEFACEPIDWEGDYGKRTPCSGCDTWWEFHSMLHAVVGGKLWEWPCIEDPAASSPYPKGSFADEHWKPDLEAQALWQALAKASAAQQPGEIALTDEQVHTFHEALGERPRAQADKARIVEAVIPRCLQPMDDDAFAKLLAASGLTRRKRVAILETT